MILDVYILYTAIRFINSRWGWGLEIRIVNSYTIIQRNLKKNNLVQTQHKSWNHTILHFLIILCTCFQDLSTIYVWENPLRLFFVFFFVVFFIGIWFKLAWMLSKLYTNLKLWSFWVIYTVIVLYFISSLISQFDFFSYINSRYETCSN